MYKVDLLKGEGIPIRSRPGGIAFACLVIVVPMIVGSAIASIYLEHRVAASVQLQQLNRLRTAVTCLSEAMETTQALHERQALGVQLLGDVKTALIGRTQWSPVLATVIDCMPDSLILSRLEARGDYHVVTDDLPESNVADDGR